MDRTPTIEFLPPTLPMRRVAAVAHLGELRQELALHRQQLAHAARAAGLLAARLDAALASVELDGTA